MMHSGERGLFLVRFNLKRSMPPPSDGVQGKDTAKMCFKHCHPLTGSLNKFYKFSLSQIPPL